MTKRTTEIASAKKNRASNLARIIQKRNPLQSLNQHIISSEVFLYFTTTKENMQGLLRKIFIPFGSSSAPTVLKAQAKIILIFNFNYAIMYKG
jgi:hypothetical protein